MGLEGRNLFCSDPVWDWEISWNTERPRLTACFRHLLLPLLPSALLCTTTALDAAVRRSRRTPPPTPLPWTLLTVCKQGTTWLLLLCTLAEGIRHLHASGESGRLLYLLSVAVRLLTYLLVVFHQLRQRRRGDLSSMQLSLFWTLSAASQLFASPLYDLLTDDPEVTDEVPFTLAISSLSLTWGQCLLSLFTDPRYRTLFADPRTDEYLVDHQPPVSRLLFSWIDRLMSRGRKEVIGAEDLDVLRPDVRTTHVCDEFLKSWNRGGGDDKSPGRRMRRRRSLWLALFRVMWPWMAASACLEAVASVASLAPPVIMDWLILFAGNPSEPLWHGPVYAVLLFAASAFASLVGVHDLDILIRASVVPRSGLNAAVYRKVFRMSPASRRGYSLGSLCNLCTVDVQRLFELVWSVNLLWSNPLRVAITLALLWRYLGAASLAGLALLLALTPLTALGAARTQALQKAQMELKDSRLRLMNDMLNGIKVLKLFTWESAFVRRVSEVRHLETRTLKRLALLNGFVVFLWILAPFLVALCSFATFVLLDERNVLDPSVAFVSLALFARIRGALANVPELVGQMVQARISCRRVTDFLLCEEQDSTEGLDRREPPSPGHVLELQGASFSWGVDAPSSLLRRLNLAVGRGHLVAVVGRVGSGKSALLAALLGEMTLRQGSFKMHQGVRSAYVPQTAWIQNGSLRDNVLFVSALDRERYDSVLQKCCLLPDLQRLPGGDRVEIGEKGVNLSGGQKQRVALARAAYHQADLYLLDDPLSAVDARVSRDIFADVLGPEGMLADKTRILVTHDASVLPQCDAVVVLSEGRIAESGTYRDLVAREGGELSRIVREFANRAASHEEDAASEPEEEEEDDESTMSAEALMKRLARRLSRTTSVQSEPRGEKVVALIEDERMEVGRVRAGVYCTYFRSAGLVTTSLVFLGFAAHQALEIGSNVWLSDWSEDGPRDGSRRNLRRMGVYGLLGLGQGACVLLATVLLALASTRASVRLHRSMLWSVMRSPLAFFETTPIGRLLNRFGKDIQGVDVSIPAGLSSVVTAVASLLGTFVLVCVYHPLFVLFCIPIGLAYLHYQVLYASTSRQLRRLQSVTLSPVLSFFSESAQGVTTVRAFRCRDAFERRHDALFDRNCVVFLAASRTNRWLGVRLQLMGCFVVLAVALLFALQRDRYSGALVGLTLSYALNVTDLLRRMVRLLTQLETRMVSVERVHEYCGLRGEASWSSDVLMATSDWPSEGSVSFRGYKMRYRPDAPPVLRGIDLHIPGGQKVGVVGRTGAGKSSLAQALFRVVEPYEGQLLVDGLDVATLGLHDLRSRIAVIPQDPVLFGGDLRLNLDPECRHTDRELTDALRMAGMREGIRGLDTPVEEGGDNLSVGERQQVCLARALLRLASRVILVLDEATASVDPETDRAIQEALRRHFRRCTVIAVAHRLHTLLHYDRILVMDEGRIAEDGSPDVLLKRTNSRFRELALSAGLLI